MTEPDRGTDRAGRRAKRFLTPLEKYEIWLQLIRQEVTMAEAADQHHVDRSTIMRIRTVAKDAVLQAEEARVHEASKSRSRGETSTLTVNAMTHDVRR